MLTYPSGHFSENYISAPMRCCPLKVLDALQNDQKFKKLKPDKFLKGKPSQNYGVSPKYGVINLTRSPTKRAHHATPQSVKAATRFTYPGGMEGWVDLGAW